MLLIHAPNVHIGGGAVLLRALISSLDPEFEGSAILDARLQLGTLLPKGLVVHRAHPTPQDRFRAELLLSKIANSEHRVLCFGNLPPLFKLPSKTLVFVQNRFLVEPTSLSAFPLAVRIRLSIERIWLTRFVSHADKLIVQTPSMKRSLETRIKRKVPVFVVPFAADKTEGFERRISIADTRIPEEWKFVYIASGEPHKNHRNLVEAWRLLAMEGLFPNLFLTVSPETWPKLVAEIQSIAQSNHLLITNLGQIQTDELIKLYSQGHVLIYPSTVESFGMPLLEARQAGLPILAAELDYVRDMIDPEETFDPTSPTSIARAVKRFLGKPEDRLAPTDGLGFLTWLEGL